MEQTEVDEEERYRSVRVEASTHELLMDLVTRIAKIGYAALPPQVRADYMAHVAGKARPRVTAGAVVVLALQELERQIGARDDAAE